MNICIVTHEYPPTKLGGGQGTYAMNLVRELISKGHRVTVISPLFEGGKPHERKGNLEIRRLRLSHFSGFLSDIIDVRMAFGLRIRKIRKELNLDDFDVIHVLDVHDSYFIGNRIGAPVIVSVNDYYAFETPFNVFRFPYHCSDLPLRYVHHMIAKVLNSTFLRKADHIISDTKYTADVVRRVVKAGNVSVVYKGIDMKKFSGRTAAGKYSSHRILYVGGNMERKGVEYLMKAMPFIVKAFPDSELTIIGRAGKHYKRKLDAIVRSNGLGGHIKHVSFCPPAEISRHYEEANVFVLPSIIEDLGQVLIESMATKTPVVTTNVGANPEAIIDGETGLLVDPKDHKGIARAVIKIFSSPGMAKRMGEKGRKRAESMFNSECMLKETIGIYRNIGSAEILYTP